jgi:hypothetical protein
MPPAAQLRAAPPTPARTKQDSSFPPLDNREEFFSTLGAEPLLGRTFTAADTTHPGGNPVVVISHPYWQQELAADPSVIGRAITVNGTAFTMIGVMRPEFYGVDSSRRQS